MQEEDGDTGASRPSGLALTAKGLQAPTSSHVHFKVLY